MRPIRWRMDLIFQDPMASLNPRHRSVASCWSHAVPPCRGERSRRGGAGKEIFARFSLPSACLERYPHELSGGHGNVWASHALRCSRPISCSLTRSFPGSTSRRRPRS